MDPGKVLGMCQNVILFYKRPARIEENAQWQMKAYMSLSYAIDSALRVAYAGYAVRVLYEKTCVIDWAENFIWDLTEKRNGKAVSK